MACNLPGVRGVSKLNNLRSRKPSPSCKFRLVCNGMGFVAQSAPIDLLPYREAMAPTQGCLGEASGYWCSGRFAQGSQGQVLPFAPTPHKLPFNQTRRSF